MEYRIRGWNVGSDDEANRPDLYYLWEWFQHIAGAPRGMRFQEIAAFASVSGFRLWRWEAAALAEMFALADVIAAQAREPQETKPVAGPELAKKLNRLAGKGRGA